MLNTSCFQAVSGIQPLVRKQLIFHFQEKLFRNVICRRCLSWWRHQYAWYVLGISSLFAASTKDDDVLNISLRLTRSLPGALLSVFPAFVGCLSLSHLARLLSSSSSSHIALLFTPLSASICLRSLFATFLSTFLSPFFLLFLSSCRYSSY